MIWKEDNDKIQITMVLQK